MLLYPDTNIFLHYRRLDEIDGRATAGAAELTLVVTQVVIQERSARTANTLRARASVASSSTAPSSRSSRPRRRS